MTRTLLITGFGPFPAASRNPSGHLVEHLQQHHATVDGLRLAFGVLPTEWQQLIPAFEQLVDLHRPGLGLHFGYAMHAPGFQLELCAHNELCGREDACGARIDAGLIDAAASRRLDSPILLDAISKRLSGAGLPWTTSEDPGRYLCNNLYFRSLQKGIASLFVHIPAVATRSERIPPEHDGAITLAFEEAVAGARLIIDALADTAAAIASA